MNRRTPLSGPSHRRYTKEELHDLIGRCDSDPVLLLHGGGHGVPLVTPTARAYVEIFLSGAHKGLGASKDGAAADGAAAEGDRHDPVDSLALMFGTGPPDEPSEAYLASCNANALATLLVANSHWRIMSSGQFRAGRVSSILGPSPWWGDPKVNMPISSCH